MQNSPLAPSPQEAAQAYELIRQARAEQELQARRLALLDNDEYFYGTLLGLNIRDRGNGEPFRDMNPESAYVYMDRFLDEPFNGKGKCIFAPRGMGKSYSVAMPRVVKRIIKNPETTALLGGENGDEVKKRALWCRTRLEIMERDYGYGPFVNTDRWAGEQWTVLRPSGVGAQDTVTIGSPDSPGTSQHWMLGVFDDAVGEWAAKSGARMADGIRWFREVYYQAMMGTEVWLFGTLWPGNNIYRFIIQNIEGGLASMTEEPYGPGVVYRGKRFDIFVLTPYDRRTDKILFCGWDQEYLEAKKDITGESMFKSQMLNILLFDEELGFRDEWFRRHEPMPTGKLETYIFTDTATSTGRVRHTSISAIFVVAKDVNDHAYLLDGRAGKMGWDRVPDTIIELAEKWKPRKIIYETTGPSKTLPKSLQDCGNAKLRGKGDFIRRLCKGVSRTADKHHRIQTMIPRVRSGKFHVVEGFPTELYDIDKRGILRGTMGQQFANYTYGSDESYDCLDAAADIWGYDGLGQIIFRAPKPDEKKSLTWENPWEYIKHWYDTNIPPDSDGDAA